MNIKSIFNLTFHNRRNRLAGTCFAVLLGLQGQGLAATFPCGATSGSWTASKSPYIVTCNINVARGQTLEIQPGVTVIVGEGLRFDVQGRILAVGTATQPITIRAATPTNGWDEIFVQHGSDGDSRFIHCNISGATNALHFKIYQANGTMAPEIANCVFSSCQGACIYAESSALGSIYGVVLPQLNGLIANCRFHSSGDGVVFSVSGNGPHGYCPGQGAASPTMANNLFHTIRGTAVGFDAGSYAYYPDHKSSPQLVNNIFLQCATAVGKSGPAELYRDDVAGYNCFYENQVNFAGYAAPIHGNICLQNDNGTPCDLLYNIFVDPVLDEASNFLLAANSPCIDAGHSGAAYDDACTNSLGSRVNDIGIHGGPYACGWVAPTFNIAGRRFVGVVVNPSSPGRYRLECRPNADSGMWMQLTNVVLQGAPFTYIDYDYPTVGKRFYRAVLVSEQ